MLAAAQLGVTLCSVGLGALAEPAIAHLIAMPLEHFGLAPAIVHGIAFILALLLVVGLPLQLAGFLRGPITSFMWLPMHVFEVPLALWLLIKGVATPERVQSA